MALSYTDSADLMNDPVFRGRIKVSCLKYANSIMIEANTVPAHNTRMRWAQSCFSAPDNTASQVQPPTVMDPAVQISGAQISDDGLQGAVEGVVNKML